MASWLAVTVLQADALTADCVCVMLNQQSVWVVMDVAVVAIGELAAGVAAG